MFKLVFLQCIAAVLGATLAGVAFGSSAAVSAALGGVACVLPSLLFAIRLYAVTKRPGASYAAAFFVGELAKIALCVGLLAGARLVYPSLHWGGVMIGLIVTLQANFFVFLLKT